MHKRKEKRKGRREKGLYYRSEGGGGGGGQRNVEEGREREAEGEAMAELLRHKQD